ncbi:2-dehydro-3-deoxy-6-phosphogalactonate aldolase [Acidovorax sp. 1608163]|uniref:2-dehydro-3-deoxy-6-phosphogalactonate aldolase n=1 Tax=Acidovorax sp. 1608163 TaxID=2478662 RepID=UPI000EF6F691|nr:2-dehydro-3-deoxy-6-phosphogalactonate aldolase [Acidovorax sp. 1608163]AYM95369.1 2-dehydro-3-deoxy-6-phosphogalactonate aldolase [Acidovorax sp. 1608163]
MNATHTPLIQALQQCGLIAILRGVQPHEVVAIGHALYDAGFRTIEVPLNSPEPLASIRALRDALPADCLVGAGTVLTPQACADVAAAGGQVIVMPHSDPAVIRAAKAAGLACAPGVATLTEAFAALAAGADVLKLFPAEALAPAVLKAWRAVLRPPVALLPVGGITPDNLAPYAAAGASGFGLGSALYRPGDSAEQVARNAAAFVQAWRHAYPTSAV